MCARSSHTGIGLRLTLAIAASLGAVATAGGHAAAAPPAPQARIPIPDPVAAARQVADRFVATAVRRHHTERSYDLVTSAFRQGLSRAEWATGTIPVVPYRAIAARWLVEERTPRRVVFVAVLLDAQAGRASFWCILVKRGRWLVDYWAPVVHVGVPQA